MDNTVEMMQPGSVLDDAAQAQAEALSAFVNEQPAQQTQPEAPATKSEPGWIKQRVNAAVEKAVAETEARLTAKYEAMLAPMRESMMDREAAQLVQDGEFKSIDRAKEYVRLKNGVNPPADPAPAQQQTQQPTRDAQGRFVKSEGPKQEDGDPVVRARADLLAKQAQKVKEGYGVDVMQVFNTDPEARQRVLSGEWDFYDVAAYAASGGRNVPVPMRSANGMGMANGGVSIANMSDEQFARLQNNLASGHSYDMRR